MQKRWSFRLFRNSVDDFTKKTFGKLLELLIQNQTVRLIGNAYPCRKKKKKLRENYGNQVKPVLMKDCKSWKNSVIWKVRFWQKLKASKTNCYNHMLHLVQVNKSTGIWWVKYWRGL